MIQCLRSQNLILWRCKKYLRRFGVVLWTGFIIWEFHHLVHSFSVYKSSETERKPFWFLLWEKHFWPQSIFSTYIVPVRVIWAASSENVPSSMLSSDSDHPAHAQSIIRASAFIHSVVSNDSVSRQWRPWSSAQSDLGLGCPHMTRREIFAWWAHFILIHEVQVPELLYMYRKCGVRFT